MNTLLHSRSHRTSLGIFDRLRLAGVFLGWAVTAACGAPAAEPAAPKPPVVFTAFAWDALSAEGGVTLNFTVRGKAQVIPIAWRDRSPPLACDGAGPLVFTRTGERDGQPVEVPVASADIPEGVTRVLLIFARNPARGPGAPPYLVKVIDDSYTVFPGQSVRFLNYSQMELGGSLGGKAFDVPAGGDQVVPAALPETNRLLPFRLARRDATAGGWKKLRSTGLPMAAGLRVLVFLIDDQRNPGRAELVLLRDQVEPETKLPPGFLAGGRITRKP